MLFPVVDSGHLDGRAGIDAGLVRRLIANQFPQWSDLPVVPVEVDGWDNCTYRLGEKMTVRLPTAVAYAPAIDKEHRWLPILAPSLPIAIPTPLAKGAAISTGQCVTEPAAGLGRRPTVKLGLHLRYPGPRPFGALIRSAAIQRCVLRHCSLLPFSIPLPPFAMCTAFPYSDYYGGSAPSRSDRPTMDPAFDPAMDTRSEDGTGTVSVFTR